MQIQGVFTKYHQRMSNRTSNNKYHVSLQNHKCLRHMYCSHTDSVLVKKKLGLSAQCLLQQDCFPQVWKYWTIAVHADSGPMVQNLYASQAAINNSCKLLGMSRPSPFRLSLVLSNFILEEVPWRKTLPTWWHDSKLKSTGGCKYLARTSSLMPLNIWHKAGTMSQLVWQTGSSESVHNSLFWSTTLK